MPKCNVLLLSHQAGQQMIVLQEYPVFLQDNSQVHMSPLLVGYVSKKCCLIPHNSTNKYVYIIYTYNIYIYIYCVLKCITQYCLVLLSLITFDTTKRNEGPPKQPIYAVTKKPHPAGMAIQIHTCNCRRSLDHLGESMCSWVNSGWFIRENPGKSRNGNPIHDVFL